MRHISSTIKTLLLALLLIGTISYAWSGPSEDFPDGNIEPPINTSADLQRKKGVLEIGEVSGTVTTGLKVNRGATILLGDLNVGTTTVNASQNGLLAIFDRNSAGTIKGIGSAQYCDEAGLNCVDGSDLGGGGDSDSGITLVHDSGWLDASSEEYDDTASLADVRDSIVYTDYDLDNQVDPTETNNLHVEILQRAYYNNDQDDNDGGAVLEGSINSYQNGSGYIFHYRNPSIERVYVKRDLALGQEAKYIRILVWRID